MDFLGYLFQFIQWEYRRLNEKIYKKIEILFINFVITYKNLFVPFELIKFN